MSEKTPHNVAAPEPAPELVRDGRLTRAGMEAAFGRGETVIVGGKHITNAAHLPSETELSQGDEKALAAVDADLDRRQAALDAERARVAAEIQKARSAPKPAAQAAHPQGRGAATPTGQRAGDAEDDDKGAARGKGSR